MSNQRQEHKHTNIRVRAWRAILEAYSALLPVMDSELRSEQHLDVQVYDVLLHTYEAGPMGIRMTDLARKVLLTKSGLTARVDKLEEGGLLERVPDPEDRRATRIRLTDTGAAVFKKAADFHLSSIERHFSSRISEEEGRVICEALERVHGASADPVS
jgi:DNA-binding MarR family transcriptional regulator